jgi:hypothetical protein
MMIESEDDDDGKEVAGCLVTVKANLGTDHE